jgi:alpha-ketoglutarate-dependent taurine dioxygenase
VEKIAISPPVTHPLVRTHPGNDHESLYLGVHASHIAGKDEAAGRGKFLNI